MGYGRALTAAVITFLAQMHPLIRPERSDLREEYIVFPSGRNDRL